MTISRRTFLRRTAAVSAGFAGLRELSWVYGAEPPEQIFDSLQKDPNGLLELPPGFGYRVISRVEERMADGFLVPWAPDGMAAFPASNGKTLLLCNSEASPSDEKDGPMGEQAKLLAQLPERLVYDPREDDGQCLGGVTTIIYDTRTGLVEKQFFSLAGTVRNCAGGPTPWNSWITCEETTDRAGDGYTKDHGYNFEVAASEKQELQEPVPLVDMGRFVHEAVAVDPASGIVYQTEDRGDGLIYRFIPDKPGRLQEGGRLQALASWDKSSLDTRNWRGEGASAGTEIRSGPSSRCAGSTSKTCSPRRRPAPAGVQQGGGALRPRRGDVVREWKRLFRLHQRRPRRPGAGLALHPEPARGDRRGARGRGRKADALRRAERQGPGGERRQPHRRPVGGRDPLRGRRRDRPPGRHPA